MLQTYISVSDIRKQRVIRRHFFRLLSEWCTRATAARSDTNALQYTGIQYTHLTMTKAT